MYVFSPFSSFNENKDQKSKKTKINCDNDNFQSKDTLKKVNRTLLFSQAVTFIYYRKTNNEKIVKTPLKHVT